MYQVGRVGTLVGMGQIQKQEPQQSQVPDVSGRPQGGAIMPPWKHYRPARALRGVDSDERERSRFTPRYDSSVA